MPASSLTAFTLPQLCCCLIRRCALTQIAAGMPLDEVAVDDFLTGRRAAQLGFIECSFPTIAGSGPNGAIIHYRAQPGTAAPVNDSQLLLVDSGACAARMKFLCLPDPGLWVTFWEKLSGCG